MTDVAGHIDPHKTRISTPLIIAGGALVGCFTGGWLIRGAINTYDGRLAGIEAKMVAAGVKLDKLDDEAIAKRCAALVRADDTAYMCDHQAYSAQGRKYYKCREAAP